MLANGKYIYKSFTKNLPPHPLIISVLDFSKISTDPVKFDKVPTTFYTV